ncbi:hypothetical protein PV371_16690 [Streptomyces sp. TX20-6-3]|nr:hypothetical protein [Streptomyces sp. TX20-6-3]MDX2561285.1 hypothetical protein [Streptomyces sp. TX20-6-3]
MGVEEILRLTVAALMALVDEIWDDVISDLDPDYHAYAYVSSVGIGA